MTCTRYFSLVILLLLAEFAIALDRPNFVWIMSEDNSKHYLKHFDESGVSAPNIEALAEHGITFDRAFSCAPVCSVARTTLITSCYAPRIGTQFHRRSKPAQMPEGLRMFPAYLQDAGYYTTNNSKEDYNAVKTDDVWNDSSKKAHWKNRPSKQTPFFHVLTSTLSHESSLHFSKEKMLNESTQTDTASVELPPYFPNTDTFRYTRATYHDRMKAIDGVVGKVVDELRDAGELENTFIFYFGDHGGVLPRSKGYIYESGLHIPLVVRVPDHYKTLVSRDLHSRTNGLVEFVDFGPTVLSLAGVEAPNGIDGRAFLGGAIRPDEVDKRNETIGYADRFDEKYDFVRSLRNDDFKYIRNFEPFYPDGLQNNYRYKMLAYEEWRTLFEQGKLNAIQRKFFEAKAPEALYNLREDPHETRNLADEPAFSGKLLQMRNRLVERLKEMPDLSFLPEAVLFKSAMSNPVDFGQQQKLEIAGLVDTVNLALLPFEEAEPRLREAIESTNPWTRYWGLVAATSHGQTDSSLQTLVKTCLTDEEPLVVMRAIEYLAVCSDIDPRAYLYRSVGRATNEPELLRLLNTAVFLNDHFGDRLGIDAIKLNSSITISTKGEPKNRLDYLSGKR